MHRIALVAAAALALAAPAFARRPAGAYQVGNDSYHLFYDDLDTTRAADRAELLRRVQSVAKRLCAQPTKVEEDECVGEITTRLGKPEIVQALAERNAVRVAAK